MLLIIGIKGMEDQAMLKLFLAGLKPRLWIPFEMLGLAADKRSLLTAAYKAIL